MQRKWFLFWNFLVFWFFGFVSRSQTFSTLPASYNDGCNGIGSDFLKRPLIVPVLLRAKLNDHVIHITRTTYHIAFY